MTFKQALKRLNIEDYTDRILNSNSHGELFHIADYIMLAQLFEEQPELFRPWFVSIVTFAEKNWQRPKSIFQHIPRMLDEMVDQNASTP